MHPVHTVSSVNVQRRWKSSKVFGQPRLPSNRDPAMSPMTAPHIAVASVLRLRLAVSVADLTLGLR